MPCFIKLTELNEKKIRVNMDLVERYVESYQPKYLPTDTGTHVGTDILFIGADSHVLWVRERPSDIDNLIRAWEERD